MAGRWWTGDVGGIDLVEVGGAEDAGFTLDGAESLVDDITGNSTHAAAGNARTQLINVGKKGRVLTIAFLHCPLYLFEALLVLLIEAKATGASVPLNFSDGAQTIAVMARPHVPRWYKRGEPDGDYIKDVSFSFITTGVIP